MRSGFRAMLKNDNFYMATQKQNEKKKQQQIQNRNLPSHKLDIEARKKKAQEKKQQQKKQKIKIHDRQIFQSNNNHDDFGFGFAFQQFIGTNLKKKKQDEDFEIYKKKLEQKKQKKAIDNKLENGNSNLVTEKKSQHLQEEKNQSVYVSINTQKKQNTMMIVQNNNGKNNKDDDEDNFDDLYQALKAQENQQHQQKVQKKQQQNKSQQQKSTINVFKRPIIFKPKSTIIQVLPDPSSLKPQQKPKSAYQLNKQRVMFEKKIKKELADNQEQIKKQQQGQNEEQGEKKKNDDKEKKKTGNKKIKKVNNYQRLDLNRRYKDQFVGGLRDNQRKFMKNGTLKPQYRKAQTELEMDEGQIYNTYIHSLSISFKEVIFLDSDSQQVQLQPEKDIEIPRIQECTYDRLTLMIKELFGFEKFRQGQYQVIENILSNKSTIFVSQTASGKSLTYILSAMIMAKQFQGMSIVISPLIALMLDQLQHLPHQLPAACISSLINYEQRDRILQLVKSNQVKLLFMTPQTLQSDILFHLGQFPKINFVCIDEAHCLSQLSHNFRTSYMALAQIIKNHISYNNQSHKPNILCLTATANTQTIVSLSKKLQIQHVIKSSSTLNKNLYITVTRQVGLQDKFRSLVDYLNNQQIINCRGVLIYCKAKWIIQKVFHYLNNSGIPASVFHGQLSAKDKTKTIAKFKQRAIRVIISTTALGMGLDFEHLDCIIHFNMAKSLQSFVQEIGRAGRRQSRAYCQLFLDPTDFYFQRNYILADQLEQQSLKTIITQMSKAWAVNVKRKGYKTNKKNSSSKQKRKQQKIDDQKQMDRIIKKATLAIQKMQQQRQKAIQMQEEQELYEQNDKRNDSDQQLSNPFSDEENQNNSLSLISQHNQHENQWSPLYYLNSKQLSEKTYLRQQALLGILMKLSSHINLQMSNNNINHRLNPSLKPIEIMKILPLSHEILKLSFFKTNQKQLMQSKEHGEFYSKLVDIEIDQNQKEKKPKCKKVSGAYHIHLIQKCNQLQMTPIQLMTKVYQISNFYTMKVQFVNQVYVFSLKDKIIVDENSNKKSNYLKIDKKDIQLCLQNKLSQQQIISQVSQIQKTTMIKLQVFYSLAFQFSQKSVTQLKKKKLIIDRLSPIPKNNIMTQITKYFNTDLLTFYHQLTQTQDQFQREMFLPTESIQSSQINSVYEYVKLFFKHQFSNLRDMYNRTQALKKKQAIIEQYKDGKVITRVFLGVNEQKSSRFIFGEHSYWRVFLKKKYFPLLKTIRDLIQQGRQDLLNC